jgi:hypothetical protein
MRIRPEVGQDNDVGPDQGQMTQLGRTWVGPTLLSRTWVGLVGWIGSAGRVGGLDQVYRPSWATGLWARVDLGGEVKEQGSSRRPMNREFAPYQGTHSRVVARRAETEDARSNQGACSRPMEGELDLVG